MAFRDINPVTPVHFLVIPKDRKGLTGIRKATKEHRELLGHLLYVVAQVAEQEKLEDGYRVVINDGKNSGNSKLLNLLYFFTRLDVNFPLRIHRLDSLSLAHPRDWRQTALLAPRCMRFFYLRMIDSKYH